MLTGIELCKWLNGVEAVEKRGLTGDCESCEYLKAVGIYRLCFASSYISGRTTPFDEVILQLHAKTDKLRRCMFCTKPYRPKSVRCSECVETKNLKNFKPHPHLPDELRAKEDT